MVLTKNYLGDVIGLAVGGGLWAVREKVSPTLQKKVIFFQNKWYIWIENPKINKIHSGTLWVTPKVFVLKPKNGSGGLLISEFQLKTESRT